MAIIQPKAMFLKYRASRQQPYVGPACRWACANARSSIFVAIGQVICIQKPDFSVTYRQVKHVLLSIARHSYWHTARDIRNGQRDFRNASTGYQEHQLRDFRNRSAGLQERCF